MEFGKKLLLCNEVELKIIGIKDKPRHEKNYSESSFTIIFIWFGSAVCVFGPVIFLEKGTKVHPRIRGNNLVTRYVFSEGHFFFQTNRHTWMIVLGIRWISWYPLVL